MRAETESAGEPWMSYRKSKRLSLQTCFSQKESFNSFCVLRCLTVLQSSSSLQSFKEFLDFSGANMTLVGSWKSLAISNGISNSIESIFSDLVITNLTI